MKKLLTYLFIALIASLIAFLIRDVTAEYIVSNIQGAVNNNTIVRSWSTYYVSILTALEVGIGVVILYALLHTKLPTKIPVIKGSILGILMLMIQGELVRRPLIHLSQGQSLSSVVSQDGVTWFIWLLMCVFVAISFDFFKLGPSKK